ncbi:DUF2182 domain-containing protein [Paralimibaculum aggregatum]|uniref:DUF2182 domain-containing protein n=1 Tax=Paralimibaculum aggregatum TaxID=3036245 RepID=A0ABQ6LPB9_9RHOB|nr:DUF2182 domain-containing protein [Limibaculum sp. NKW23]GMG82296.1 DUF2182 domain-containing protein [Limibaculum sp. NKW23]
MAGSVVEGVLRRDRAVLIGAMGVLFVLAGLYTVLGLGMEMTALEMTRMAGPAQMPGMTQPAAWGAEHALLVFLMWWVMMIAMMMPAVAPVILLYAVLLRRTSEAALAPRAAAAFLAGYLAAWAGFGLAAALAQWWLEAVGLVSARMMTLVGTVPGALVMILAGAYQFSPLKDACLTHCRSPAEFIARRRRPGIAGAARMGAEHGIYCLGCCWVLMALLFVGGVMNLYWIVGLAALVAAERLAPIGRQVSRVAGAGLIAWGAWALSAAG